MGGEEVACTTGVFRPCSAKSGEGLKDGMEWIMGFLNEDEDA